MASSPVTSLFRAVSIKVTPLLFHSQIPLNLPLSSAVLEEKTEGLLPIFITSVSVQFCLFIFQFRITNDYIFFLKVQPKLQLHDRPLS